MASLAPQLAVIDVTDPLSPYVRSSNPIMRFELKPNFRVNYTVGLATTNEFGLRDVPRKIEAEDQVRRIVLLGDSVVEGINYVGDEDTIPRHLEQILGDGTEVLNVATSGYCTLAEVELLKRKALQFDPDIVVVLFTSNDFMNFHREFASEGNIVERSALVKWLYEHCHIYRIGCLRFNWHHFRDEAYPSQWNLEAIGQENNVVSGLRELRRLADEHDFETLLAVWPAFLDDRIVEPQFMNDGSGDLVVERLAWSMKIPTVRLSDHFRTHWKKQPDAVSPRTAYTVRTDMLHPNPRGCRVAAEALNMALTNPETRKMKSLPHDGFDPQAVAAAERIASQVPGLDTEQEEEEYLVLERQFRIAEMESYLRERIDSDPNDYRSRIKLGLQLARQQRFDEALPEFVLATDCSPEKADEKSWRYVGGFFFAAAIYKQVGNDEKSREFYERGCEFLGEGTTGEEAIRVAIGELSRGVMKDEALPEVVGQE